MSAAPPQPGRFLYWALVPVLATGFFTAKAGEEESDRATEASDIRSHKVLDPYGGQRHWLVDTSSLPKELSPQAGEVALIPDPLDRGHGLIAVYLVNSSKEPLRKAIHGDGRCWIQVRKGNDWLLCQEVQPGCGSYPAPRDLDPGKALIFSANDPTFGDLEGELRYCVEIPGAAPVVSRSFRGKYPSKFTPDSEFCESPAGKSALGRLRRGPWRSWSLAQTPEELIAALEIERCSFPSLEARQAAVAWRYHGTVLDGGSRCKDALEELLSRPWNQNGGETAMFERCYAALSGPSNKSYPFGSPERCRAYVWEHLTVPQEHGHEWVIDPERWAELETIRTSGNPWGVPKDRVDSLVTIAANSIRSPYRKEQLAAGWFLCKHWRLAGGISDAECRNLLESGSAGGRIAGAAILARRGNAAEVGEWIFRHQSPLGEETLTLWKIAATGLKDLEPWEIGLAVHSLETMPLRTAEWIKERYPKTGQQAPGVLRAPLRAFLSGEAKAPTIFGTKPSKDTSWGADPQAAQDLWALHSSLELLSQWDDAEDTTILRQFLGHPASQYNESSGGFIRRYSVRRIAERCLKARGESIPSDIILDEVIPSSTKR